MAIRGDYDDYDEDRWCLDCKFNYAMPVELL